MTGGKRTPRSYPGYGQKVSNKFTVQTKICSTKLGDCSSQSKEEFSGLGGERAPEIARVTSKAMRASRQIQCFELGVGE